MFREANGVMDWLVFNNPTRNTQGGKMAHPIFRDGLLGGKVAVVTGGATGIGAAIAYDYARLGARVAIASRKKEKCERAAKGLAEMTGAEVLGFGCDIRERDSVKAFVADAMDSFGQIDVLVNNGGGQFMSPAELIRPRGWDSVIQTNLTGTWNMIREVAGAHMLKHGGRIINITMLTHRGWPGMAHSVAARSGVESLTRSLAVEWATKGIRINCIQPGIIASSGVRNYPGGEKLFQQAQGEIPAKRVGSCEEVAQLATYLASPAADYVTGQVWAIDGGRSLWGRTWPVPNPKSLPPVEVPAWPWEES
jgi:NAD(P)-dependent dehydrogenase (short-subunit alcohol dehydrogenase family)